MKTRVTRMPVSTRKHISSMNRNKKKEKGKSQLELHKDAIAVDAKNREAEATKEYNLMVAEIKKKYNVVMVYAGQYRGSQIQHFISFQSAPITLPNQGE